MKDAIKKILFTKLASLSDKKVLLWPDLQIAFEQATGHSINDYLDDVQATADELEVAGYVRFDQLPNGMPRIVKGIDFDKWADKMDPSSSSNQINISSLNVQNMQVGDGNTMNVNITPEEFLNALNKMQRNPEKTPSLLSQLNEQVKKGLTFGETVAKFIALFS